MPGGLLAKLALFAVSITKITYHLFKLDGRSVIGAGGDARLCVPSRNTSLFRLRDWRGGDGHEETEQTNETSELEAYHIVCGEIMTECDFENFFEEAKGYLY
jgi:hypothetical protein